MYNLRFLVLVTEHERDKSRGAGEQLESERAEEGVGAGEKAE